MPSGQASVSHPSYSRTSTYTGRHRLGAWQRAAASTGRASTPVESTLQARSLGGSKQITRIIASGKKLHKGDTAGVRVASHRGGDSAQVARAGLLEQAASETGLRGKEVSAVWEQGSTFILSSGNSRCKGPEQAQVWCPEDLIKRRVSLEQRVLGRAGGR